MAGSYNHCTAADGQLLVPRHLLGMLDASYCGDAYEAIEEFYGMVWYLAEGQPERVEEARQRYQDGLALSPGIRGKLPDEEDDE